MTPNNQVRTRIDPHLMDVFAEVSALHGMDISEMTKTLIRHLLISSHSIATLPISKETREVQAIVDAEIARMCRASVVKKGKDEAAWVQEMIEDARSRVAEQRSPGLRFYVLIGGRTLGPHRLDKLREWHALGVLAPETLTKTSKSGEEQPLTKIPRFLVMPTPLRKRLDEQRKAPLPDWWNLEPTEAQLKRLAFFDLPYEKKGLTRGRASVLITHFAFLDPGKEEQWKASAL